MILLSLEKLMHICEFEGEKKFILKENWRGKIKRILFLVETFYIVEQQLVIRIMYYLI